MECVSTSLHLLLLLFLLLESLAEPLPSRHQVTQVRGGQQVRWNSGDRPASNLSQTRPPSPPQPPPTIVITTTAPPVAALSPSFSFSGSVTRRKRSLPRIPHHQRRLITRPPRLTRQRQRRFRAASPQTGSHRLHTRLRANGRTKKNRELKNGRPHKFTPSSRPTVLRDTARATYVIRGTPYTSHGRLHEVPRQYPSSTRASDRERRFRHYNAFNRRAEESEDALRSRASRQTATNTPDTIVKDGQIFHRHNGREENDRITRGQSRRRHARPGDQLGLYDEIPQQDGNGGSYFTAEALNSGGQSHARVVGNVPGVDSSALTLNGGQLTQARVALGEDSSSRAQITDHHGADDPILASTVGGGQKSGAADSRARAQDAATTHAHIEFSPDDIEREPGEHGAASAVNTPNGGSTLATLGGQTIHGSYLGTAHSSTLQVQPLRNHQVAPQTYLGGDTAEGHNGRHSHGLLERSDMVNSIMETVHQPDMLPEVAALPPPPSHLIPSGIGVVPAREGLVGGSGVPPLESEIGRVSQQLHEEQEGSGRKVAPQAEGQVGVATYFQGELGTPPNETDYEDYRYDPSTYYDFNNLNYSTDYLDPTFSVEPLELDFNWYPTAGPGMLFPQSNLTSHTPLLIHRLQTDTPDLSPHLNQSHHSPTSDDSQTPDQPKTPDQTYIPGYTPTQEHTRLTDHSETLDHIPDYSYTPDQSHIPALEHPDHYDTQAQPHTPDEPYPSHRLQQHKITDYTHIKDHLPDYSKIPDYSHTFNHTEDYSQTPDRSPDYPQTPVRSEDYSQTPDRIPDHSQISDRIPDYSQPSVGIPDDVPDYSQVPDRSQDYYQTPDRIPDHSQISDRIPDYYQPSAGIPDYSQSLDYSQTPDHIPDYFQTPERIPDYSQAPDHIPDYSHTPEHIPDYSQTSDHIPDYSQTPDRVPDYFHTPDGIPDYSQTPDRIPDYSQTPDHIPDYSQTLDGSHNYSHTPDYSQPSDYSDTPVNFQARGRSDSQGSDYAPDFTHKPEQPRFPDSTHAHEQEWQHQTNQRAPAQPSRQDSSSGQVSHTTSDQHIPPQPTALDQFTRTQQPSSQSQSFIPSGMSVSARDRGTGEVVAATPMPMGIPLVPGQPGTMQTLPNGENGLPLNVITMGTDQSMKMSVMKQQPGFFVQPGEKIPGASGYRIPAGFRARVILGHGQPVPSSGRMMQGFNTHVRLTPHSPASGTMFASVTDPHASRQLVSEGSVPGMHVSMGGSRGHWSHQQAPQQHLSSASHHMESDRGTSRQTDHPPWTDRQLGNTRPFHRGQQSHRGTSSTDSRRGDTSPPSKSWGRSWNAQQSSPQNKRKCGYFIITCMIENNGPQRQCQPSYKRRNCCC